jgi:hypothetical protein
MGGVQAVDGHPHVDALLPSAEERVVREVRRPNVLAPVDHGKRCFWLSAQPLVDGFATTTQPDWRDAALYRLSQPYGSHCHGSESPRPSTRKEAFNALGTRRSSRRQSTPDPPPIGLGRTNAATSRAWWQVVGSHNLDAAAKISQKTRHYI